MRNSTLLICLLGAFLIRMGSLPAQQFFTPDPINPIFGDSSFLWKYGRFPGSDDPERARVAAHLEYAEFRLRKNTPDEMDRQTFDQRMDLLNHLRDYRLAGEYPLNYERADRRPCFIDSVGRICAVGYLMEQTIGREAAEAINQEYKYAFVGEMQGPMLSDWISGSGLSPQEFAMIQPAYGPVIQSPVFIGNKSKDLQLYFDQEVEFPLSVDEPVELIISFMVSKFGNPQWPVRVIGEDHLEKKELNALKREMMKLKFKPSTYDGEPQDFNYSITLSLYPELESAPTDQDGLQFGFNLNLNAADLDKKKVTFEGQVKDLETGEEIPFATVVIPGLNVGCYTDEEGRFSLEIGQDTPRETYDLRVKYLGYKTLDIREIPYNDQMMIFALEEEPTIFNGPVFHQPHIHLFRR